MRIGPERASQFIHLMPVFGLLLAVVLLHEQVLLSHAAGAVGVFAGLALAQGKAPRSATRD